MKYFFVIALLCASLCSFAQKYSQCGFTYQTFAITAGVAKAQSVINAAPDTQIINPQVYQGSDDSWCYAFFAWSFPPPEPLPAPLPKYKVLKEFDLRLPASLEERRPL